MRKFFCFSLTHYVKTEGLTCATMATERSLAVGPVRTPALADERDSSNVT